LDTDVEIRDAASNLGDYDPVDGAKFLATDSNEIYLGTGTEWTRLGVIPQSTSTGGDGDGSLVATPGNVQPVIDQAASNGGGTVKLDPTQRYEQPSSPWLVKTDVALDFNGAIVYGTGSNPNTDVIHIQPTGQVFDPKVDLWNGGNGYDENNQYAARVFVMDADLYGPYFGDGTTIRGGWTAASNCADGTWIYMSSGEEYLSFLTIETDICRPTEELAGIHTLGTGIHVDSGPTKTNDGGGWNNSVQCYGNWRDCLTTVKQSGRGMNFGHVFDALIQPPTRHSNPLPNAVWHIEDPGTGEMGFLFNRMEGVIWDVTTDNFPNQDAFKFDGFAKNNAINAHGLANDLSSFVVGSGGRNYVGNPITYESTTV
jgi:hypothetical protein